MQRYRLVPGDTPTSLQQYQVAATASSTVPVAGQQDWNSKVVEIVGYLPKNLQGRARILLASLQGQIGLTQDNFVIYKADDGQQEEGSSIVTLTHWITSAATASNGQQTRPFDLVKFAKLLKKVATPSGAYGTGKKKVIDSLLIGKRDNWLTL